MSKWFRCASDFLRTGRFVPALVLAIAAPTAWADDPSAPAPTPADQESSILVATRDNASGAPASRYSNMPTTTDEDGAPLQPTSQFADRSPDLADGSQPAPPTQPAASAQAISASPQPLTASSQPVVVTPQPPADDAEQFGAALAEVARSRPGALPRSRTQTAGMGPDRIAVTAAGRAAVPFEPAKFNGVQPGVSTKVQLLAWWGEPAKSNISEDGGVLIYNIEPFSSIEVLISPDDIVAALKIELNAALNPKQLAKQLALDKLDAVTIADDDDVPLGQAYPEKGVVFMFAHGAPGVGKHAGPPPDQLVTHVAIQPLDARAFALRAENRLHGPYEKNINDLITAISLDPDFTHARWLLAEIYLATGQADQAEAEANEAVNLAPENAAYQLRRGQALILLGEFDDAVHQIRAVLDREDAPAVVRAQALHEMARLAALGDAEIAAKAISFNTRAIETADPLASSHDPKERRAAKRLLVEAHLAVAEEIGRQSFTGKIDALSLWVGRASGLAEDFIDNDDGSVELRLIVAQRALAALAGFKPTLDPAPWIAEAEEAANKLQKQSEDPLWQKRIHWELGIAYFNALRVEHLRREMNTAIQYGQAAVENLADGASSRQSVHSAEQMVGQLYFHVGAVYAVHQQDHRKAVQWYDKAAPLLTGTRPTSELYSPRRDGELLVSMGVTYWQTGQQARAVELTQAGANLVETAVEHGILGRGSLAVPYGNLATMYQQIGESANAAKYATLVKSVTPGGTTTPRTGPQASRPTTSQVGGATQPGRTGMMQTGGQQGRTTTPRR